ncbi:MarR family winged helix-turn-helix transcriptional regulator [Thalassospira lucentensis]|uniref:MarR family winged helix-turn-helix transcriptional regulator n=1 Tax=Thalassospira lucentensis TaxID=168935 RepID=UPI00142D8D48|nr:MarR family transcriptional regulator [Thalassospira lucentensis]NIZ00940.1 winged helix DNA-binding protein [Thalassospira lucentensis]
MTVTHLELANTVERIYRRFADLLRVDLIRLGKDDISPAQVALLFTIGEDELSVRDLLDRGHYMGSNASYNLKQLAESGYVERQVMARDKRSARLKLTTKGRELCQALNELHAEYHDALTNNLEDQQEMETALRTLRRLEEFWTQTLRYGGAPINGSVAVREARNRR